MNIIDEKIYENLELLPLDLTGWNGDKEIFNDLIKRVSPKTIIEVGSWKGLSAINMANSVKSNELNAKIYCVDTWLGAIEFWSTLASTEERNLLQKNGYPQIYYQFLSNVVHTKNQDIILPFPNTSENGFRYFKHMKIKADLIYIDASHEEDDVYKDIKNYYELLNDGGIIFGDDYIPYWSGVINAVDKFSKEINKKVEVVNKNFWIIKK